MCLIRVGGEEREFVSILLLGRAHPNSQDYWDGNWLRCEVEVVAGGFRGVAHNFIRVEELVAFHRGLGQLHETLTAEVALATMERWLSLRVVGRRGQVVLEGELWDQSGSGNRLIFQLDLDQSYLPPLLRGLGQAISEYPVVGHL